LPQAGEDLVGPGRGQDAIPLHLQHLDEHLPLCLVVLREQDQCAAVLHPFTSRLAPEHAPSAEYKKRPVSFSKYAWPPSAQASWALRCASDAISSAWPVRPQPD